MIDYNNVIIPEDYFESNIDFARNVIDDYEREKDKALSWYCPKTPFVVSKPKLTDNAFIAKKVLRKIKAG